MMNPTTKALEAINVPKIRLRLAVTLGVTENTIRVYIKDKSDNLTKAAAMQVIREETGLGDHEILEPATTKEPQN